MAKPIGLKEDEVRELIKNREVILLRPMRSLSCPFGAVGDRLWVREVWHRCPHCEEGLTCYRAGGWKLGVESDDLDQRPLRPKCAAHGWSNGSRMKRNDARFVIVVQSVYRDLGSKRQWVGKAALE
jgi:hypothetical protein